MALIPPQGGNPNPPSIASPMQPQFPTPPRQQSPLMQPSPIGQQTQSASPFSNPINNNASASPFNQPMGQPQQGPNGQTGFKPPTFGGAQGDASKALIQSQNNLIQAINKLTQSIGNVGKGGSGGTTATGVGTGTTVNANPSNTTTTAGYQNTFGGLKAGTGLGDLLGQAIGNRIGINGRNPANVLPQGNRSLIQAGGNTLINAGMTSLGYMSQFGSASTIADIVKAIPFIGPVQAAGYQLAANKAGPVANLQQLNMQSMFSSGFFGGAGIGENKDLANFAAMGIGPEEALQMQLQAKNVGFGRFTTSGPTSALAFGANLSQFARRGFSATTAGLTAAISDKLNPAAMSANNIFGLGANMGMNDATMQSTLQSILGIQKNVSLQGGRLNAQTIEGLTGALSYKGAFTGEAVAGAVSGMAGVGRFENPYGDYANQVLQSEARKFAPGDYFKQAQFLEQLKGDPARKFKLLEGRLGARRAKEVLAGQEGLTTEQISAIAISANNPNMLAGIKSPFTGQKMEGIAGIELASQLSTAGLEDATTYADKILAVSKANRRIEKNQLDNLKTDEATIDRLVKTAETANDIATKGFDTLVAAVERLSKGAEALSKLDFSMEGLGEIISGAFQTALENVKTIVNPFNYFGGK
jgi:hypothetical protein